MIKSMAVTKIICYFVVRRTHLVTNHHTYFLFRFRLSEPPLESKSEASRVAGFLEARNAEIRRYFALVDI